MLFKQVSWSDRLNNPYLAMTGVINLFAARQGLKNPYFKPGIFETGKFSDNLRVTENGLVSGVDRAFKSSNSTFQTSAIDLTHSKRVSTSTSSFLAHRLAYSSHASMMILKLWCHENETGSLYFGPLHKTSFSFW